MGGNKPFHPYGTATLIEAVMARLRPQCGTLFVACGPGDHPLHPVLAALGLPMIEDGARQGLGPLCGILAALEFVRKRGETGIVTAPCDMPVLPQDYIARLNKDTSAEVAFFAAAGRDYPLCARWSVTVESRLAEALDGARPRGGLAVREFLARVHSQRIEAPDPEAFLNINCPDQLPGSIVDSISLRKSGLRR